LYEKQAGNKAKVTLVIDGEQAGQGSLDNAVLSKFHIQAVRRGRGQRWLGGPQCPH
jgi:hypothetical protein